MLKKVLKVAEKEPSPFRHFEKKEGGCLSIGNNVVTLRSKRNVVAVTGIRTARLKREPGEIPGQNPLL